MQDDQFSGAAGILTREDGASIAYHALPGKGPGVVFLHGLKSDMQGTKALATEEWCRRNGRAFVRFDAFGHGQSSGDFVHGTMTRWAGDAVAVLDHLTEGPQILVGSSMGGWAALLAALQRRDRIAALVTLAAAPDFTEELMWHDFSAEQRRQLLEQGWTELPNCYSDEPYRIGRALIEDGRNNLLLPDIINLHCPVRLIHGQKDEDVPWRTALRLSEQLASEDVEMILVKNGDHRLSSPADIARLWQVLDSLAEKLAE
ncbi:carboxylesterase [Telmatospirillum sp. J64-1]|uniref:alpha/beta hydrolase n=1 Tax=Telmatospirillum sp. J64-1 TaxID=2502183 RepID=UPI00115F66CF|nr:alpha/beta hydrolase [Telmatospirillum sp. J64-1]